MTIPERPVIDDRAYDNEVFGPLNFSGAMLAHQQAVAVAAVRALWAIYEQADYIFRPTCSLDLLDLGGDMDRDSVMKYLKPILSEIKESGWRGEA